MFLGTPRLRYEKSVNTALAPMPQPPPCRHALPPMPPPPMPPPPMPPPPIMPQPWHVVQLPLPRKSVMPCCSWAVNEARPAITASYFELKALTSVDFS